MPRTRTLFTAMVAGAAGLTAWTPIAAHAAGDLLIAPTRVVFEGRERTAALSITNTGHTTATYRISWVQRRMTDAGEFETIEAPAADERFADEMVRFSPRQVVLPPGVAQTVRLQLRKPAQLAAGEYRSHLLFRAVPEEGALNAEALAEKQDAFGVNLTAIYGVSIPVIVRQGETTAALGIRDLAVAGAEAPKLKLRLDRDGNRSVYGDLKATFVPVDGQSRVVGQLKGLAVYTPNRLRNVELPLQGPLGRGKLQVTFQEDPDRPPLAAGELTLR